MTPQKPGPEGAAERRPRRGVSAGQALRFTNRTLAVVIGLFAIGYLVLAFQVPEYTAVSVPVQPGTLPRWLGVALLVLAVLLFFQRGQTAEDQAGSEDEESAGAGAGADTLTVAAATDTTDTDANADTDAAEVTAPDGADAATGTDADTAKGPSEPARLGRLKDPRLEVGLFVAALVVYVALFEPLGFVLSTALYLSSMTAYLGYRRHLVNVAVAVLLPLGLYLGMTTGLGVILPSGPLPF